jgi:hypothetical protein
MQSKIKLTLPAFIYLALGMLIFIISRSINFPPTMQFSVGVIGVLISLIFFYLAKAFLGYEKISLAMVNLVPNKGTFNRFSVGIIIGAIITGIMLTLLFTLTEIDIERVPSETWLSFLLAAIVFVPLALMEELLFRGYPFFRLTQVFNIRWVLLITATLFAFYHYNDATSISSIMLGPGIWGVTFGVAAYLSKSIAVPLGMHFSANAMQALFGLKLDHVALWKVTKSTNLTTTLEPEHLGLIMQLILLVVSVIVLELGIRKNNINPK